MSKGQMAEGKTGFFRPRAERRQGLLKVAAAVAILAVPGYLQIARSQQSSPAAPVTSAASERALLDQYCVTCHNQRLQTGGLSLDKLDVANLHDHAETWE